MLSDRGRRKLIDIQHNIHLAQSWVSGTSLAQFSVDAKLVYAVTRALEIVSEASRGLDVETKARHPGLPWTDIAGAGNIYRHDYEDVGDSLIWKTVTSALPDLLTAVEAELLLG